MKIKLVELVNAKKAIEELSKIQLPLQTAFALADIAELIEKNNFKYENEKNKIVQKYAIATGEKTEDGTGEKYNLPPENTEAYNKEIEELNSFKIDINFDKVKLPDWIVVTGENARKLKQLIER